VRNEVILLTTTFSPTIIAPDVDMQVVTNRIAFGKFYNAGQVSLSLRWKLTMVTSEEYNNKHNANINASSKKHEGVYRS
jgi:acyl-CoA reductase-like NAD-dependent aldehyde dehydrogenase